MSAWAARFFTLLGMGLEDVVHHRQAEAAHQFSIELQVAVAHAFAQTMEVGQQMPGLLIGEFDDRVLVERDAPSNAIVVRRQQVLQELVVSCKPFDLQVGMGGKVADAVGHRYHHQIVLHDVVAMLVEHKTPLPCLAKQMHTGVAQLSGIHPVEVGGISEI